MPTNNTLDSYYGVKPKPQAQTTTLLDSWLATASDSPSCAKSPKLRKISREIEPLHPNRPPQQEMSPKNNKKRSIAEDSEADDHVKIMSVQASPAAPAAAVASKPAKRAKTSPTRPPAFFLARTKSPAPRSLSDAENVIPTVNTNQGDVIDLCSDDDDGDAEEDDDRKPATVAVEHKTPPGSPEEQRREVRRVAAMARMEAWGGSTTVAVANFPSSSAAAAARSSTSTVSKPVDVVWRSSLAFAPRVATAPVAGAAAAGEASHASSTTIIATASATAAIPSLEIPANIGNQTPQELELFFQKLAGPPTLYSLSEFIDMWDEAGRDGGFTTEEIEHGRLVRGANSKMASNDGGKQSKAQYGRILPTATQYLFQSILDLQATNLFLDIGHGIGNTCLQAAYTIGCDARGIELVDDRNVYAITYKDKLQTIRELIHCKKDGLNKIAGTVEFERGRLEDPAHFEFLTNPGRVVKAFANNFGGVFAEKSAKASQMYYLDNFVSGLFAKMSPGSVMVTLHPLDLGPSRTEANQSRQQHGLLESLNASFYADEKILLGKANEVVSWSQFGSNVNDIFVHKYTRLEQETGDGSGVFLCCNPKCEQATNSTPISATMTVIVEGEERVVMNHCKCKLSAKKLRIRKETSYNA